MKKSGVIFHQHRKKTRKNPVLIGIGNFKKSAPAILREGAEEKAKDLATEIRQVIYRQEYNWKPLTEAYAKAKEKAGLDPRILIATKKYVQNIQARKIKTKLGKTVWVVGNSNRNYPGADFTYRQLSKWLEWGTKFMPSRQHFRPVYAKFLREVGQSGVDRKVFNSLVDILLGRKVRKVTHVH